MLLNIALSVWFFVQSLCVLDDEKRERMVLRYLTADILSTHVRSQLHNIFLNKPVECQIIKNNKYSNLTFEDYSFEKDYSVISSESSKQEVIKDIYVRPLKIILWHINMYGHLKKKQIEIALFSKLDSRDEFDTLPLFKIKNIEFITTEFSSYLNNLKLETLNKTNQKNFDCIYFDGNHSKKATLEYFETLLPTITNETIWIFDDIHWSQDMEEAWEIIKDHPKVTVTIDTFQWGLVFFRKEQNKEHFCIKTEQNLSSMFFEKIRI